MVARGGALGSDDGVRRRDRVARRVAEALLWWTLRNFVSNLRVTRPRLRISPSSKNPCSSWLDLTSGSLTNAAK